MADFSKTFKKALETSAEAVSKAAAVTGKAISKAANASGKAISHAATTTLDNARFKMDELGTIRRRNEVIAELGAKMYELFLAGVELPADAAAIAAKVQVVDCELDVLRSEHNARKQETGARPPVWSHHAGKRQSKAHAELPAGAHRKKALLGPSGAFRRIEHDSARRTEHRKPHSFVGALSAKFVDPPEIPRLHGLF